MILQAFLAMALFCHAIWISIRYFVCNPITVELTIILTETMDLCGLGSVQGLLNTRWLCLKFRKLMCKHLVVKAKGMSGS